MSGGHYPSYHNPSQDYVGPRHRLPHIPPQRPPFGSHSHAPHPSWINKHGYAPNNHESLFYHPRNYGAIAPGRYGDDAHRWSEHHGRSNSPNRGGVGPPYRHSLSGSDKRSVSGYGHRSVPDGTIDLSAGHGAISVIESTALNGTKSDVVNDTKVVTKTSAPESVVSVIAENPLRSGGGGSPTDVSPHRARHPISPDHVESALETLFQGGRSPPVPTAVAAAVAVPTVIVTAQSRLPSAAGNLRAESVEKILKSPSPEADTRRSSDPDQAPDHEPSAQADDSVNDIAETNEMDDTNEIDDTNEMDDTPEDNTTTDVDDTFEMETEDVSEPDGEVSRSAEEPSSTVSSDDGRLIIGDADSTDRLEPGRPSFTLTSDVIKRVDQANNVHNLSDESAVIVRRRSSELVIVENKSIASKMETAPPDESKSTSVIVNENELSITTKASQSVIKEKVADETVKKNCETVNSTSSDDTSTACSSKTRNQEITYVEVESELEKIFAGIDDTVPEVDDDPLNAPQETSVQNDDQCLPEDSNVPDESSVVEDEHRIEIDSSTADSYYSDQRSPSHILPDVEFGHDLESSVEPAPTASITSASATTTPALKKVSTGSAGSSSKRKRKPTSKRKDRKAGESSPPPLPPPKLRVPVVHVVGPKDCPLSVHIVNSIKAEEDFVPTGKAGNKRKKEKNDLAVKRAAKMCKNYDPATSDESWICIFCKLGPHSPGMAGEPSGDLFGPYFVTEESPEEEVSQRSGRRGGDLVEHGKKRKQKQSIDNDEITEMKPKLTEVWAHENCFIWSSGIYLVGSKLIGIEESVREALKRICTCCGKVGANIGCRARHCQSCVHYSCALYTNWKLDPETFITTCKIHKVD